MQRGIPHCRGSFQSAFLAKIRNAKDLFGKVSPYLCQEGLELVRQSHFGSTPVSG